MDLSQIYSVAKAHSLTAIAAYALERAGIRDERFRQEKGKAIRKNITMDIEREKVLSELEKLGIWYMPLKGIILQNFYPMVGMRQMCDNDILFDNKYRDQVHEIMTSLGFKTKSFKKDKDDIYFKPPVCNFEMHISLFSELSKNEVVDYYRDLNNRLVKSDSNPYQYGFSDDDLYIYLTVHEYKHFSKGGTGLRSLVDTYVFLNHYSDKLDMEYIRKELEKLNIADFEQKRRNLAMKVFSGNQLDADEKQLLDYYIFSGTYGTTENTVNNSVDKTLTSKIKYLCRRLFPTLPEIRASYPFFYKHKILIPFLFIYRIGLMLTKSRKRVLSEIKTLTRI